MLINVRISRGFRILYRHFISDQVVRQDAQVPKISFGEFLYFFPEALLAIISSNAQ
jgi:hypothetical protein